MKCYIDIPNDSFWAVLWTIKIIVIAANKHVSEGVTSKVITIKYM